MRAWMKLELIPQLKTAVLPVSNHANAKVSYCGDTFRESAKVPVGDSKTCPSEHPG